MTHFLGKHSSTGDLQCTRLRINNVDIEQRLAQKLEATDLSDKQDALTIQNTISSTFDGTLYAKGALDLSNGTLAYIPPVIVDWTSDQGDSNIDANNIPILPYAANQLASNGIAGLTNFNFNATRKAKLDSIEENAQANPSWLPATDPNYLQSALDFNLASTHYVQNPIGNIPLNRSVAQLESDYSTLYELIEAMLKIEGTPQQTVSISGASLSFTTTGGDREFGTAFPTQVDLSFNRGTWVNAIDPTVLPHTGDGILVLNGLGLTDEDASSSTSFTVSSPKVIDYSKTSIAGSFTSNQTLNATLTTDSTSTGSVVDNYGVSYNGPISQTFNASLLFTVYKPLFVNNAKVTSDAVGNAGGGGQSGENGTVKVLSNTTPVIIVDHVYNHTIEIPFEPNTLQIYVEFGNTGWSTQTTWSKVQGTRTINGQTNVVYWTVTWTGANRVQVDVKLIA
jgi:hypothetical protein